MNRAAIVIIAVSLAACGKKDAGSAGTGSASTGSAGSAASGSAAPADAAVTVPVKVVPLAWTNADGSPLLELHEDGALVGPCGPVGKLAGGNVVIGEKTLVWTGVERTETPDRTSARYRVEGLPWTIEVDGAGTVQMLVSASERTPLGKVAGTASEDGKTLFAALVLAAPMATVKLELAPADGKPPLELIGAADMAAWTIKQGDTVIEKHKRSDAIAPPPPFDEAADGTVKVGGAVIGKLIGRAKCGPHDKAAAALIHAYRAR